MMFRTRTSSARGFSLIEVMLAVFILGIGLIMVASLFPVGANWTRQSTEDSISQIIAQDALGVIRAHYGPGGNLYGAGLGLAAMPAPTAGAASPLQALPGFTSVGLIPLAERSYQFGSSTPFPAVTPSKCMYFWTVLGRRSPVATGVATASTSHSYDIYILVMHKGAVEQTFVPAMGEITGTRNTASESFVPSVASQTYNAGVYTAAQGITGALPAMGQFGIGLSSGTVFRQITAFTSGVPSSAVASPALSSSDLTGSPPAGGVIYCPVADNTTSGSPLVYVFQTTLSSQ
jgi:prepilin-type N-terminal cleavage/methylation domain-containing protein